MYQFYCEYRTKGGQRCGETIFARDSLEAREIIKMRPDFDYLFINIFFFVSIFNIVVFYTKNV